MRAVRLPLFVLLTALCFVLWNAAWITDRCAEWADALDARGQDVQGYLHIVVSHTDLDEAESLMAQAQALSAQGSTDELYPVLSQLRHQFRLIAETQQLSPKNIF